MKLPSCSCTHETNEQTETISFFILLLLFIVLKFWIYKWVTSYILFRLSVHSGFLRLSLAVPAQWRRLSSHSEHTWSTMKMHSILGASRQSAEETDRDKIWKIIILKNGLMQLLLVNCYCRCCCEKSYFVFYFPFHRRWDVAFQCFSGFQICNKTGPRCISLLSISVDRICWNILNK